MKMGKSEIKILIIYIGRQNMRYQQWDLAKYLPCEYTTSHPSDAFFFCIKTGCRKTAL